MVGAQLSPPSGVNTQLDLTELIRFGEEADAGRQHWVAEGGFIVPGYGVAAPIPRSREEYVANEERRARGEEARSTAPAREGRRASATTATAARPTSHPVERGLSEALELEVFLDYRDDAIWSKKISSSPLLWVPAGLFRSLPFHASILLEVPARRPVWAHASSFSPVPLIRAWAWWNDGITVRAHHEYPDDSMCVCRPDDWQLGTRTIEDYVGYCTCWIGKVLYSIVFGRWPGVQHMPGALRVRRNRPDEYCGCGSDRLYRECHMSEDHATSKGKLYRDAMLGRWAYRMELRRRGLPPHPWEAQ